MKPKDRVKAAIQNREPDRVPVTVLGSSADYKLAGVDFEEAMMDPDLVVECIDKKQEIFPDNDIIQPIAPGQMVSAWKAMGAEADILSTGWFDVTEPGVENKEELEALDFDKVLENVLESPLFQTGLEAIERISDRYGDEYLISSAWESGWTTAGRVIDTEKQMILLKDEPEFVKELANFMNQIWIEAGRKYIEAGLDMVMTPDPNSMTALISPDIYKEVVWPLQMEMGKDIKESGAYWHLHICGDAEPLVELIGETGCDMFSFNQRTRMSEVVRKVGDWVTSCGNVNPGRILRGNPEEIKELAKECIRIAAPGGGYILMPGCDTAENTPKENYQALIDAALEHGEYPIDRVTGKTSVE
ncbi:MAG: Methylcobalamin:coenzyme M methyltransferase MtbA [Candidatus Methanohalarchaeum thermophilum]|uniref:Methylcobalamin:coenzyme M methyltransferase MtbA n=1 Tax=Methanohalarchaeum thermophilum TaxID=1903181 RepID=A0A1Q6DTX2_METT1|nr:MAG: Methylcobalamin:coenzyme M methyltransferase MtbA [Candidatus Methanohalarchaeum thermophilum]